MTCLPFAGICNKIILKHCVGIDISKADFHTRILAN